MFTLTLLAEMSMSESVCNFPCWLCCFCMFFSGRAETVKIPASWAKRYVCVVVFFTIMVAAARGAMMVHGLFVEFE